MEKISLNRLQYKFWMDSQLKYPSSEFNDTNFTFIVSGDLSLPKLRAAYKLLALAYPPFHSHIKVEERKPCFFPDSAFDIPNFFEVKVKDEEDISTVIHMYVNEPFDLKNDYPCRFYAFSYKDKWYLLHLFHHMVMDGWILNSFFEQLSVVYRQVTGNMALNGLQRQWMDQFSIDLENHAERHHQEDVDYWKQLLRGQNLQIKIPHLDPEQSSGCTHPFSLGNVFYESVMKFCSEYHTTPFRLYAAAWALALSRISQQSQLLLDHTVNVCPLDMQPIGGVFVNNLPMPFDFSDGNQTFLEVLATVGELRRKEKIHQGVSYHDFLKKSTEGDGQKGGLNVGISYPAKYKSMILELEGCIVEPYGHVDVDVSEDLVLMIEDDQELNCNLRHQSHYSSTFVSSLAMAWSTVLQQVMTHPESPIQTIELVPQNVKQHLQATEDKRLEEAVMPACFLSRFKGIVEERADAIAVEYGEERLTYRELDLQSDRVAACLSDRGWYHQRIGLYAPKKQVMIVAILAIIKSGNTYIPIDYNLPEERLRFMTHDCEMVAVLKTWTTPNLQVDITTLNIEDLLRENVETKNPVKVLPSDEAYIIYTSGTTGQPKAIPIQHSMLNQMICNVIASLELSPSSRVAQFANISFDGSIYEIFPVLNVGGTLVLPQEEERKDPALLHAFLEHCKISVSYIPPVLLSNMRNCVLPDLKQIIIAGDTTPKITVEKWSKDYRLVNSYGPSENTVGSTYAVLNPQSVPNDIGIAEPGVTCYVLDKYCKLVPDGCLGELYLGGVKLTKGYINRPELNREKFIPNPYVSSRDAENGKNLYIYKTGDLVIRRKDGHLMFVGRSDFQVKLNGFRIELGEIEAKIGTYGHDVKSGVVILHENGQQKKLVAYVQVTVPEKFDETSLRTYLQQHLPHYMVPALFIPMAEFPSNASGKVDHKQLPDPDKALVSESKVKMLQSPTELQLAGIWRGLLPGHAIGRDDDFNALGGDSMLVINMAFDIEEQMGVVVKVSDVYRFSVLKDLAAHIDEWRNHQVREVKENMVSVGEGHMPLSPAQMSLWLQCIQSEEIKDSYNLPCLFECPDLTDEMLFEKGINRLVKLQDGFRMFFPIGEDRKPYVEIADYSPFTVEVHRISSALLLNDLKEDMQVSFDLDRAPLFRVKLYQVDGKKYYCSLVMHHLISDGSSVNIIQSFIKKWVTGEGVDELAFKGSYAEYATRISEFLQSDEYQQRLNYWGKVLEHVTDLHIFKNHKSVEQCTCGGVLVQKIQSVLKTQVKSFCMECVCTPFELFCATYLLLLSKLSDQTDFVVGFPYLGREHVNDNTIVGYFVQILPLRYYQKYNDMTFDEYIDEIHFQLLEVEEHAVTLDQLVKLFRSKSGEPDGQLVQTVFAMGKKELFHDIQYKKHFAFGLSLSVAYDNSTFNVYWEYQSEQFSIDEVGTFAEAYATLLERVVNHSGDVVTSYSLANDDYQQNLMAEYGGGQLAGEPCRVFLERFRDAVTSHPNYTAVGEHGRFLTYAELNEKTDQIATNIHRAGIASAASIAVNMTASVDSVIAIVGILKAGCCYVPIDVDLPEQRRDFILSDAGCVLLFNDQNYPEGAILNAAATAVGDLSSCAYIIYTSGTTGKPKGVPVRHEALAHLLEVLPQETDMTSSSKVLLYTSLSFDASVTQIFTTLSLGATLVIAAPEERKDVMLLADLLEREEVSYLEIPAAILPLLPQREFPHLSTIIVGGESSQNSVLKYWAKGRKIINAYGPTENTVDTTLCVVDDHYEFNDIGLPLRGVSCYVLDQYMNIVPANVRGELYIGGRQLTEGYLNRPELNQEKFVENPFATLEDKQHNINTRLYKTGDVVIRRPNGHLIYSGRSDFQVKLHGYRIELGDIEHKIQDLGKEIKHAVVLLNDQGKVKHLVAYVHVDNKETFSVDGLREGLFKSLPSYMVPSVIIPIEEIPTTVNGKVDRRRLPDPGKYLIEKTVKEAPLTDTEKYLSDLWEKLLPEQRVGRDDEFNLLGGDSLGIIQMTFDIEKKWGISVRTSDVYRHPKLRMLASFLDSKRLEADSAVVKADKTSLPTTDPVELAPAQLSLWLQCMHSDKVKNIYNLPCFFECPPTTDATRFEEVFNHLLKFQDSFRISFPTREDGKPFIQVTEYKLIHVNVYQVSTVELPNCLKNDMKVSFDLSKGPLYRVKLYLVDGQRYCCSLVMHHLVSDGWSAQLIQTVICRYLSGQEVNWDEISGSYVEYAYKNNLFKESEEYQQRLEYWKSALNDVADLQILKKDRNKENTQGGVCRQVVSESLRSKIDKYCYATGYTSFELFSAVYLLLLARISHQSDFAVGFPFLGREHERYNHVVGYFVHTLPLCYHRGYNELSFTDYLEAIHRQHVEVAEKAVSLDQLVSIARNSSGEADLQLVQTMFVMGERMPFDDVLKKEQFAFGLVLSIVSDEYSLSCNLEYQNAQFSAEEVQMYGEAYISLLQTVVENPNQQVVKCSLASEEYRNQVIAKNDCGGVSVASSSPFLHRFAKAVAERANHPAVGCFGKYITYKELDQQSDNIAEQIRDAGIKAPASIAVNRGASVESIVIILGILKSGCCYVPIDVALPEERRDFILKDADCQMIFDEKNPLHGVLLEYPEKASEVFENCAYIIYTSGTTGQPKGVPVHHDALAHLLEVLPDETDMTSASRVLLFTSLSFDASITQIFTALSLGATLVIAAPEERKDVALLADLLEQESVSYLEIPAAVLPLLPHREYPHLSTIVVGGESSKVSVLQYWAKGRRVINAYGPTENTVDTTLCVVDEQFESNDIGLPLHGVSCYVLDKFLNIVPANMEGDLYIGGVQLTSGYLNRPELNEERFVENPYVLSSDKECGINTILYKSGDVVVRRPNGHLIFKGRSDRQIKLHGFRIELSDVETRLMRCEGVQQAVVEINRQDKQLVAFVQSSQHLDPMKLQRSLKTQLPDYMVPVKWAVVPEFPLTVNGKIDRRRLPEPEVATHETLELPATAEEEWVLKSVCKVMATDSIGVTTDLLDAGMTSLQMMELVSDVSERVKLTISALYEYRTIRDVLQKALRKDYFWANEYSVDKPLLVLVCGYNDYHPFYDPLVAYFKDQFSIFVLDSFKDFIRTQETVTCEVLINHFMQIMTSELHGKPIYGMLGHCLGAELAMHCAKELSVRKIAHPKVLLFGPTFQRAPDLRKESELDEMGRKVVQIIKTLPKIDYAGEVIIGLAQHPSSKLSLSSETDVDAETFEKIKVSMVNNKNAWKKVYPSSPILELDADHWTFFEKKSMDKVWSVMKTYWHLPDII